MDPRAEPKALGVDIVDECTERDGTFPRKALSASFSLHNI